MSLIHISSKYMTSNDPLQNIRDLEEKFQKYRQGIELKYLRELFFFSIVILLSLTILIFFSFIQFSLLTYFLKEQFYIPRSAQVLGLKISDLLGFITAGLLPISVLIDESNILDKKPKININFKGEPISFHVIWIVVFADFLITFLALTLNSQLQPTTLDPQVQELIKVIIPFIMGVIFTIGTLYISKGTASTLGKIISLWKNYQVVVVYGFDPDLAYEDKQKIQLLEVVEAARREAKKAAEKLEEEIACYQYYIDHQAIGYEQEIQSQSINYQQKIEEIKQENQRYQEYLASLNNLRSKLNNFQRLATDFIPQSQVFSEKFKTIDETIKNLNFPHIELKMLGVNQNPEVPSPESPAMWQPIYSSSTSWEETFNSLSSRLFSPSASMLFQAMKMQNFTPPTLDEYAPRAGLSKCLVLYFKPYDLVVYCRDEIYEQGEEWDTQDELKFKAYLTQQNVEGLNTLQFTTEEIMSNLSLVIEQIKNAFLRKKG